MKRIALAAVTVIAIIAAAFWWLMLDARAPAQGSDVFALDEWRAMVADDQGKPTRVAIEFVGGDDAPGWAAQAGSFGSVHKTVYTSFMIETPGAPIVVGGAVDRTISNQRAITGKAWFDDDAYDRMATAMLRARAVIVTHEHFDHVGGIARFPDPAALAPRLKLTGYHIAALARFGPKGAVQAEYADLEAWRLEGPQKIAPGVIVAPTPGHSPGSQVIFVSLTDGSEHLLIGDIVWRMTNLDALKTRPRLLQYVLFEPNEDRTEVLRQVRALKTIRDRNPDLTIIPSHDELYLKALVDKGALECGFNKEARP